MRQYRRNARLIYYAHRRPSEELIDRDGLSTGETQEQWGERLPIHCSVSARISGAEHTPQGTIERQTCRLNITGRSCPVVLGDAVWIEHDHHATEPEYTVVGIKTGTFDTICYLEGRG